MTTKTPEERRKALKKILTGAGAATVAAAAPEKWTKPVINSVTLPAHAETSQLTEIPLNFGANNLQMASLPPDLLDSLIPLAHAGAVLDGTNLCINFNADMTTYNATAAPASPTENDVYSVMNGTVGVAAPMEIPCDATNWTMTLSAPRADGVDYVIAFTDGPPFEGTALPQNCTLVDQECDL